MPDKKEGRLGKFIRRLKLAGDPDATPRERFRKTVADLKAVTARINASDSGINRASLRGVMIRLRKQRKALQEDIVKERTSQIRASQKAKHV